MKFATNYTVTKATDEVLAMIYAETVGSDNFKRFLDPSGKIIETIKEKIPGVLKEYKGKFSDKIEVRKGHNLVPSVLRDAFACLLSGETVATTFEANYFALGSGTTTPANTDTTLETEIFRGTFTNRLCVDNVVYLDKFFPTTEVGGLTVNECGVFCDGTASADSGFLLSRILINESMSATETLTVNVTISIV